MILDLLVLTSAGIWLYLLLARGNFWRVEEDLLPETHAIFPASPKVLAIVPARNEVDLIAQTLPTLLEQDHSGAFGVVLVDDHSEDGTAEAAMRAAEAAGFGDRLMVLKSVPLPSGWTGKLWAMQQGLDFVSQLDVPPDLVLFTDADIAYRPGVLRRLVDQTRLHGLVLASLMVRLRTRSAAERWLVPAFVYFFRMLYPFSWVNERDRSTAAAAGGTMLINRDALVGAGGLLSIRDSLIDDCALGELMKRHGPIWLGLTRDVESLRPYPQFGDIRRMVVRSAYAELRYSPLRLLVAILGLTVVFFVPLLAVLFADGFGRIIGFATWALMTVSYLPMLRLYRISLWQGVALPFVAALYAAFTLQSASEHRQGRGGTWKGRVQASASGRS